MSELTVLTEPLGGSPLGALAVSAEADEHDWFVPAPLELAAWTARMIATQERFDAAQWYDALRPAFGAAKSVAAAKFRPKTTASGIQRRIFFLRYRSAMTLPTITTKQYTLYGSTIDTCPAPFNEATKSRRATPARWSECDDITV